MSNLISRKKLMEQLRDNVLVDVTPELERTIMEQPTAYDVDKVVMEMKRNSFERYGNVGIGGQMVVDLDDAMEIVKVGGLNE